jgi:putative sigma-54 modulation protein
MNINFITKNVKFPGALKAYAEKQLQSIEKIAGDIIEAEVIVGEEKILFKVEISLKTRLGSFYSEERDRILKQALRSTLNTIKSQAKKTKEKLKEEKKRQGSKEVFHRFPDRTAGETAATKVEERKERVLISDNFSRKPITVEEAIFYLKESSENGFMFINSDTHKMAAVFLNRHGGISLVEPGR